MSSPVLLTVGLSRSNFMLSDAKTTDFLDSCSIPFPSLLLYFYPSYSFLLVTKENLYHLLTTLGYKFSCIFFHPKFTATLFRPISFSLSQCLLSYGLIQSPFSYIKLFLD